MRTVAIALLGLGAAAQAQSSSTAVTVKWLEDTPTIQTGTTFGIPWARGQHLANGTTFTASTGALQSWITAYWPDGSIKWSGHAIPASDIVPDEYTIAASGPGNATVPKFRRQAVNGTQIQVDESAEGITVNTGKITASFPKSGDVLVSSIKTSDGKTVGKNGRLILRSQSGIAEDGDASGINYFKFASKIYNTTVSSESSVRALITIQGIHATVANSTASHKDWLPFTVRFYLYANSDAIRTIHTFVFDGDSKSDFISALGIRFDVPLSREELYDRHVRIAGVDGGILHEAVQGLTGLRRDPGAAVRSAQYNGTKTPDKSTWDTRVSSRLQWIPTWGDYRVTQLSADGFNIKKRTKAGQSWVKIPGGTRAGGLAYLGGASVGGLAVGLRDFWKKYPTSLDISNAATDVGSITLWLYSPQAEPMDLRPYHDGLGEDTYAKQLDALEITYEDFEDGYNTPYGIARTNELFIYAFSSTPSADTLSVLTNTTNTPPVLVPEPEYIESTAAIGTYWKTPSSTSTSDSAATIESHLDFLIQFYRDQIEQRRWYGFWDHGDIMHGYDTDRHQWKYDVGGYAWDNSELSPDLFFWTHFLRTGRADIYRLAEAQVRHGGEVDSYHLGNFTGLGTRHGVQHWGDSAKQVRISTPVYRKTFYYISGGDERTGDLVHEVLQAEKGFYLVDARRKVRDPSVIYTPDPTALYLNFGTDWAGVAAAYLLEWERRGPRWEESRAKLLETFATFPLLKFGFVTGEALYDSTTGAWAPPPTDPSNNGTVNISHLSAVFGVLETLDQLFTHYPEVPRPFVDAWLDYCYYYGASKAEQKARYGKDFGTVNLRQGHARLTAYAAYRRNNATLAARAWNEFLNDNSADELGPGDPWSTVRFGGSSVLAGVEEAEWITTNAAALFGLSGIENLALVGAPGGNGTVRS
ncbi:hypothetical protein K458DRAFT_343864 [Lentithecium fluviatile CBS 122367]|uniref:Tat pathway signal sequence domain protein n=1 Tax=Lentithecium fluviatile CBS 122367 TaxID=1168545 RepID=A0A6G1ITG2_9PLEO|nr:hypothetical protein K458DRAFT_343864 [Lentithecium fluviatile CBS 122367]